MDYIVYIEHDLVGFPVRNQTLLFRNLKREFTSLKKMGVYSKHATALLAGCIRLFCKIKTVVPVCGDCLLPYTEYVSFSPARWDLWVVSINFCILEQWWQYLNNLQSSNRTNDPKSEQETEGNSTTSLKKIYEWLTGH